MTLTKRFVQKKNGLRDPPAYHAHPENILLSMLADDNKDVRVKAVG